MSWKFCTNLMSSMSCVTMCFLAEGNPRLITCLSLRCCSIGFTCGFSFMVVKLPSKCVPHLATKHLRLTLTGIEVAFGFSRNRNTRFIEIHL